MAKKLLLTITNPPAGMHESQLFDDKEHLNTWLDQNKAHLDLKKVTDTSIEFGEINPQKPAEKDEDYKKRIKKEKSGPIGTGKIKEVPADYIN